MSKQPKAKASNGSKNDDRKNGKAFKTSGIKHKGVTLTDVQKVLLGGGMYVNIHKRIFQSENTGMSADRKPRGRSKVA